MQENTIDNNMDQGSEENLHSMDEKTALLCQPSPERRKETEPLVCFSVGLVISIIYYSFLRFAFDYHLLDSHRIPEAIQNAIGEDFDNYTEAETSHNSINNDGSESKLIHSSTPVQENRPIS